MRIKLTLRYIVMVLVSTILLMGSAFFVLTYMEEAHETSLETPHSFTYRLADEIQWNENEEAVLSEEGLEWLVAEEAWLQILDKEGYVVGSYNTTHNLAEHYSPFQIELIGASKSFRADYIYNLGITSDGIDYIVAVHSPDWFEISFEIDKGMLQQFGQIMLVVTGLVLLVMGFIFSRRIAKPVTKIVGGVEGLAVGDYEPKYIEKGLYKPVFTQLNQLASRLQSSEMERQKTKELRDKWISNISHDLKTPLSTIKGYSGILADEDYAVTPDEINRYSNRIYEQSLYMEEMIEELRLNEQLMQEGIKLDMEPVNIVSFVREIIVGILNHPEYINRTIEFNTEEDTLVISLSEDLMRRGIENLIYNALLHNDADTVVTVNITRDDDGVSIEIIDNGRGMNEDELNQLFNRYYRGSNTKSYRGTGLGMSIAKEVIEAHEGNIHVESELTKGTKISIAL